MKLCNCTQARSMTPSRAPYKCTSMSKGVVQLYLYPEMIYWLLLIALLAYTTALVHYKKLDKGSDGCLVEGIQLKVGEVAQDKNVCGVYHCQSKEGDSLIMYCQIPPFFAECINTAIVTTINFPECCWTCAHWKKC